MVQKPKRTVLYPEFKPRPQLRSRELVALGETSAAKNINNFAQ